MTSAEAACASGAVDEDYRSTDGRTSPWLIGSPAVKCCYHSVRPPYGRCTSARRSRTPRPMRSLARGVKRTLVSRAPLETLDDKPGWADSLLASTLSAISPRAGFVRTKEGEPFWRGKSRRPSSRCRSGRDHVRLSGAGLSAYALSEACLANLRTTARARQRWPTTGARPHPRWAATEACKGLASAAEDLRDNGSFGLAQCGRQPHRAGADDQLPGGR